jgi:hypothetical protein
MQFLTICNHPVVICQVETYKILKIDKNYDQTIQLVSQPEVSKIDVEQGS